MEAALLLSPPRPAGAEHGAAAAGRLGARRARGPSARPGRACGRDGTAPRAAERSSVSASAASGVGPSEREVSVDAPRPAPPALPGRATGSGSEGLGFGPRGHLAVRGPMSPARPLPCALGGAPQRGWTDPPGLAASRPRPGFPTSLAWPRTCCSANARAPGGSAGPCGPTALSPARCRLQRLASFAGHFAKCRLNARSCVPARERGPPGRTAGSGGSWPGISGARGRRRAHSLSCLVPKPGRRLLRAAPGSAGPQSLGRRQRQRGGRGGVFRAGPGSPRCWAPTG